MASPRGQREQSRAAALGELVRRLRRGRSESLAALAERVPMSASNLSRVELGKQGPPSDEVIERIAAALDAKPEELLRAAGRVAGGASFEDTVLARLDKLDQDMQAVRRELRERTPQP